jgi:hypothetical protein
MPEIVMTTELRNKIIAFTSRKDVQSLMLDISGAKSKAVLEGNGAQEAVRIENENKPLYLRLENMIASAMKPQEFPIAKSSVDNMLIILTQENIVHARLSKDEQLVKEMPKAGYLARVNPTDENINRAEAMREDIHKKVITFIEPQYRNNAFVQGAIRDMTDRIIIDLVEQVEQKANQQEKPLPQQPQGVDPTKMPKSAATSIKTLNIG